MVKIAVLATGDEVIEGEILNTNSQVISQKLTDSGFYIGQHLACRDSKEILESSIKFLLSEHEILITIGGLGPTVDDLTRFAVASYLNLPLEFYCQTWLWIENRYKELKRTIPDTNKQQALFPIGSEVFPNDFGSADGAVIQSDSKTIIMLPGPPNECLPMLDKFVLPYLNRVFTPTLPPLLKWRIFGLSESFLADKLNHQFKTFSNDIAYRWHYPYIDVKYRATSIALSQQVQSQLDSFFKNYIICENNVTASEVLKDRILSLKHRIDIDDRVTGGFLQCLLMSPKSYSKLSFSSNQQHFTGINIVLTGLDAYWNDEENLSNMSLKITIKNALEQSQETIEISHQPLHLIPYISELISNKLNIYLSRLN